MKYVLTKTSHKVHHLNGKELESKSFLSHDLMHIAYAKITSSREGFFADKANEAREEMVVGMLQGQFKEYAINPERYKFSDVSAFIDDMLRQITNTEPVRLTEEVMRAVFSEYNRLRSAWENLRTGESLTVEV